MLSTWRRHVQQACAAGLVCHQNHTGSPNRSMKEWQHNSTNRTTSTPPTAAWSTSAERATHEIAMQRTTTFRSIPRPSPRDSLPVSGGWYVKTVTESEPAPGASGAVASTFRRKKLKEDPGGVSKTLLEQLLGNGRQAGLRPPAQCQYMYASDLMSRQESDSQCPACVRALAAVRPAHPSEPQASPRFGRVPPTLNFSGWRGAVSTNGSCGTEPSPARSAPTPKSSWNGFEGSRCTAETRC